ncbi:YbjN domain-containing protein [Laspinema olomoucense]|uniref:YbjN domain-containing protein n=1 Tax=Laspinema olomoucense TaxID=3231600 RepID=UPI0021BB97E6|nr:YbjN domain-containing protein [Laspinema sp. D3c]MCT7996878.1 YbjN domain-containing protein [Laspinema sp. D3c]
MGTETQHSTQQFELSFLLGTQEVLSAKVVDSELFRVNEEPSEYRITLEINWLDYQRIVEGESFNLTRAARSQGEELSFDENHPLEIELRLDEKLFSDLIQKGSSVEELANYLIASNQANSSSGLFKAGNWYILDVKQAVDLPPDLEGMGELKMGYRTAWADENNKPEDVIKIGDSTKRSELNSDQPMLQIITEALTQNNQPLYQWESDHVVSFPYQGKNEKWRCYADAREEMSLCCFYSIFPDSVPKDKRAPVAELLTRINYILTVGNFEMDFEDGEVRFRTSIDVEGDRLSKPLFRQLTIANVTMMDRYLPAIRNILENDQSPASAIAAIED